MNKLDQSKKAELLALQKKIAYLLAKAIKIKAEWNATPHPLQDRVTKEIHEILNN